MNRLFEPVPLQKSIAQPDATKNLTASYNDEYRSVENVSHTNE
jgi:hypothetical protein